MTHLQTLLRRLRFQAATLVALLATLILPSCDSMIASTLEGTWEGDMYFSSFYDGEWYYSNYTVLEFHDDPFHFKRGTGYWVDYYSDAPWDYVANHFDWEVRDKVIYIYLVEDDYNIEIRNYRLTDEFFRGDVYYEGEMRHFDLVHTFSLNWDEMHYGSYYSNSRGTEERPVRHMRPADAIPGTHHK